MAFPTMQNAPSTSAALPEVATEKSSSRDYKGFVAGVFSGIAKLTGMLLVSMSSI